MGAFPFALGFKLSLGWRGLQEAGHLPPAPGGLYRLLAERGFDYFEFAVASCSEPGELALLRREAELCRDAGLGVALHPYLAGPANPGAFGEGPEAAAATATITQAAREVGQICGRPMHVVLHPAAAACEASRARTADARRGLLERSRLFFAQMERCARATDGAVRPVAEHQLPPGADEPVIRIGDSCAELMAVVAGTGLGLCWDTGHYIFSVERGVQAEPPPDEFVRRVTVVHLHDVARGQDHQPISPRSARVGGHMGLLRGAGFAGAITLEYSEQGVVDAGRFEPLLDDALAALRQWWG